MKKVQMVYTTEKFKDNIAFFAELSKMHYEEVAPYSDIALNVNWNQFIKLEEVGVLKTYGIRENDFLVGYALFFVNYSMEYSDSLQASMNNIFIHPDHRGQGLDFIQWCDEQLKEEGVQVVYHHVKVKNDYGKLLNKLGYEKMNVEYSKRLD